jgi:spore coat polysaccharide biosynthesis predicted glycosyltransferase SpsG/GNAT superfamily N-acetyltransferase
VRIVLRCDGGGSLGVGHVMRSLALAEAAVAAGHEVVLAGHFEGPFLAGQLASAPVEVVQLGVPVAGADPQPLIDLVGRLRPDVLHVDSYDASGQAVVSDLAFDNVILSNMEDGTFGRRPADVVVDPTFGAELSARPDDGSTWLLRGSRYTPLRQRVLDASRRDVTAGEVARTVLVVMGGTDPVGLAPPVVGLLARTGLALEVTVIAVDENADRVRAAARGSRLSLTVLAPVDDLAALMSGQDLVISAAGTTVWELCCIGVPMALVWAVDNQREGYDRVVAAGAAVGLGGPELGGPDRGGDESAVGLLKTALRDSQVRADLVLAGRGIVDGLGAWRVVRTCEQALGLGRPARPVADAGLVARPATLEDARRLWEWRNDPGTRAGSRNAEIVPWLEHLAWLESSLTREGRVLLLMEDPAGPVGTVRWDLRQERKGEGEHEWEVSITVAPDLRGQSLARPMLRAAEAALLKVTLPDVALSEVARSRGTDVTAYLAVVHVDNRASVRLFETSGYVPDLPPDPRGFMRFRKAARVT